MDTGSFFAGCLIGLLIGFAWAFRTTAKAYGDAARLLSRAAAQEELWQELNDMTPVAELAQRRINLKKQMQND